MAAESWMLSNVIEVLGWTLLHFVWQGVAAVVLLAAVLLMLRRASAHARYLSACGVFALMALAPLVTLSWLSAQTRGIDVLTDPEPRWVGRVIETQQAVANNEVGLDDSTHPTEEMLDLDRTSPSIVADAASVGSRTQAASATASETTLP